MKTFNNIGEMSAYYNERKNTYEFYENGELLDIELKFNLNTTCDLTARDIKAHYILVGDINAHDIKAWYITANDIKAKDIEANNITANDIKAKNIKFYT